MSTSSKEYEMSLVEADDKFRRIFQSKDMTNIQCLKTFDNMVEIIEHYDDTVGLHWSALAKILEKETGKRCCVDRCMTDYT
jgi:hypothetical protein